MIFCSSCHTIIMTGKLCQNCINIEENLYEKVNHNYYVRCPHCACVFDVAKTADYKIGTIVCQKCESNFNAVYNFQSPPVQE